MSSIFTKIIQRDIPAYIVYESELVIAFLDVFPVQKGHVLVVPKEEVDNLFDLEDDIYQELWHVARIIAKAIELRFDCQKVGVSVIGLEVPHAHIHLMPINSLADMDFSNKLKLEESEFQEIQQAIHSLI